MGPERDATSRGDCIRALGRSAISSGSKEDFLDTEGGPQIDPAVDMFINGVSRELDSPSRVISVLERSLR